MSAKSVFLRWVFLSLCGSLLVPQAHAVKIGQCALIDSLKYGVLGAIDDSRHYLLAGNGAAMGTYAILESTPDLESRSNGPLHGAATYLGTKSIHLKASDLNSGSYAGAIYTTAAVWREGCQASGSASPKREISAQREKSTAVECGSAEECLSRAAELFGNPEKKDEAKALYAAACDKGSAGACFNRGMFFEAKSSRKARIWFQKGCDLHESREQDEANCFQLVYADLKNGHPEKARGEYQKVCTAAEHHDCETLGHVGGAYFRMMQAACKNGHQISCQMIEQIKASKSRGNAKN